MVHVEFLLLFKNLKYFSKKTWDKNLKRIKTVQSLGLGAFF